jgi:TonB-linked SusC/RagA family outer membrane protein
MTKQLIARAAMIVSIFAAGLLGSGLAFAQNPAIRGKVVDTSNTGVIGAAVLVPGTTNGVQTDLDGNFEIRVAPGTTLEVSCIGYSTVRVAAAANMVVVLEDDAELLDETVVIGYGVQKKSDLTGSVASVRADDLQNRSTADAASALQGKAAGVQILNYSGAPGQGAAIRVRGYSSNSGNIGPLLIVDGLKVDNIQYLDPSMIESMEILKDAASAAIYGAEAGNGVVLITTKSGASNNGRSSITYDLKVTNQSLAHLPGVMNAEQFIDFKRMQGYDIDFMMQTNKYDGTDTDWSKALFEPSWSQQHALTFQGGNNNGHFFVSLNYLNNNGIVVGDKDVYTRLSTQINADYQIKKWLQVGTNNSIERWSTKSVSHMSETNSVMMSVIQNDPLTPVYYTDPSQFPTDMRLVYENNPPEDAFKQYNGPDLITQAPDGRWYAVSNYSDNDHGSPLIQLARNNQTNEGVTLRGSMFANFTPIKGLVVTSRFGYRISYSNSHNYSTPYWANTMAKATEYNISAGANTGLYYQWENFANYNFNLGKNAFTVMAGMSFTHNQNDNVSASASGPDILSGYEPNFRYLNYVNSNTDTKKTISNSPGQSAQLSYFGRLTWSYDNRYSLQANFRADAFDSSKLSKQNRWGYFPSFSAGWTISNEPFFKNNVGRNAVSFLKLRASWGRNGNINVLSGYPYSTTIAFNAQNYEYGPDAEKSYGSQPSGLANPNLKWETSEQFDVGLDARFFNNRLTLGVDWYNKDTKDLLVSINPVPEIGVSSTTVNGGNVNNTGFEVELGWKDTVGDFRYSINGNFSTLKNKVTYLDPTISRILYGSYYVNQLRTSFEAGYPIWYMYGYQYDGYDASGKPILHDFNGDGEVADADKTYIGKGIPDYTFGLTINLEWKGIDFTLFGTGVAGNDIFPVLYRTDRPFVNTLEFYHANSWSPQNTNARFPDPAVVKNDTKFWASSANIFDGSYFKIKQIQLGYTLPSNITKKIMINTLRVYVSLDDFFTFTSYPGLDPETATTTNAQQLGVDLGTYPTTRKVVFGLNVNF